MTKHWPVLYKKTSSGELQQWRIWVDDNVIHTEYGRVDGKLQTSTDVIKEGKNVGKINATDATSQALSEAQSKYDKQLKKRYVLNVQDAAAGKVDTDKVQGGVPPMLSINKSYPKDPILDKYLKMPCIIQPKLDGVRCVAVIENGKATLWSRTQKQITSMPHIVEELEGRFPNRGKLVLDGELYTHTLKDEFQTLISIVRQEEPDAEGLYKSMEYWVYDMPESSELGFDYKTPYKNRQSGYRKLISESCSNTTSVVCLGIEICNNLGEVKDAYERYLLEGYEGAMAKDLLAPYESGKRSVALLKMKEFVDAEFLIIGMEEGRGKFAGLAAKLVCQMDNGKVFKPSVKCPLNVKRWYWEHQDRVLGKMVTVCYKRLTDEGVPYIPVAKALRESFDI